MEELAAQLFAELCGPGKPYELGPMEYICNGRKIQNVGFKAGYKTLRELYDFGFENHADKEFIVQQEVRLTFAKFKEGAFKIMTILKDAGIKPGDKVAISSRNTWQWTLIFVAITYYGAIAVPLNGWWTTTELEYGLINSKSKLLFCDEERAARVNPVMEKLSAQQNLVLYVYRTPGKKSYSPFIDDKIVLNFEKAYEAAKMFEASSLPPDRETNDVACIMYTSGTTGNPKGVLQTHNNFTQQMRMTAVGSIIGRTIREKMKVPHPEECTICPIPLFHATALVHIFTSAFVNGKKVVLMLKWDVLEALKLIQAEKPNTWGGVPTMVQDLMAHKDFSKFDTSSLTSVGGGGAPTPVSQLNKVKEKFGSNVASTNGYGLTETTAAVAVITGSEYDAHPSSCGKPLPFCDVVIVDQELAETGKFVDIGRDVRGEILIKGPGVMRGYYNDIEKTNEAIVTVENKGYGYFRSGDVGRLDSDGYLYIMDRAKDIIIRGGENISCSEVESAIYEHPDVLECAVYGVKHERFGEVVGCRIVLKPGAESATKLGIDKVAVRKDILATIDGKIAKFKCPEEHLISFQKDPLIRGGTGKILKRAIRDEVNKEQAVKAKL